MGFGIWAGLGCGHGTQMCWKFCAFCSSLLTVFASKCLACLQEAASSHDSTGFYFYTSGSEHVSVTFDPGAHLPVMG